MRHRLPSAAISKMRFAPAPVFTPSSSLNRSSLLVEGTVVLTGVALMIFHVNRLTLKPNLTEEQRRETLELMRQAGAANPAVRSLVVGRDLGGDFERGAVYVLDDLDGYWTYLTHRAHVHSEMKGIPLLVRFEGFDITHSHDPEIGAKMAGLQRRNFAEHPEVAALVAQAPAFRVPEGKG